MARITHNPDRHRYELFVDDALASFAEYRLDGDSVVIFHTETAGAFRGRGLAAELVEWALNDVREKGQTVVPQCWFVADFIQDHPEYRDLVAA